MPTKLHEALLLLFRDRPDLAPTLLSGALGAEVPFFTEARVEAAGPSQKEGRAVVIVLLAHKTPVFAIVVDAQAERDAEKRSAWPAWLAGVRARLQCPAYLMVVAIDSGVAAWCAEPIEIGPPDFVLHPPVLGPSAAPIVTDEAQAAAMPELAVLSAIVHGRSEHGASIASAALSALAGARGLGRERAALYRDWVLSSLNEGDRPEVEAHAERGRRERSG